MSLRSSLRKLRRAAYEFAGNGRYSRPALNDLDNKLSRYLTGRHGVFIEAGANDGFSQSNTYYLEKFLGWSGILVEAIPSLYKQARRCRSRARVFNCALVPFALEGAEIKLTYGNLMSFVDGAMGTPEADAEHLREARRHDQEAGSYQVKVRGRALSSLIEECGLTRIDFLSLDVEGYEEHVLRGLDFTRHRPTFICVETLEARHRFAVGQLLLPYYQLVEQLTERDLLYRAHHKAPQASNLDAEKLIYDFGSQIPGSSVRGDSEIRRSSER